MSTKAGLLAALPAGLVQISEREESGPRSNLLAGWRKFNIGVLKTSTSQELFLWMLVDENQSPEAAYWVGATPDDYVAAPPIVQLVRDKIEQAVTARLPFKVNPSDSDAVGDYVAAKIVDQIGDYGLIVDVAVMLTGTDDVRIYRRFVALADNADESQGLLRLRMVGQESTPTFEPTVV